jgi:transposase-like protein
MDTISQDEKERFKQVVYKIRSEHNATTKEIARRAGVHQSTLYRWLELLGNS